MGPPRQIPGRWLLPITLFLVAIASLIPKSDTPAIPGRYAWDAVILFGALTIMAIAASWVVAVPERWERMTARLRQVPLILPAVLGIGALLLVDFTTTLLDDVGSLLPQHLLLFVVLGLLLAIATMLSLASTRPRATLQNLALALLAVTMCVCGIEVVMRLYLVEFRVPRDEAAFNSIVSASWPHPVAFAKPPNTFRILGLSDSFGRAGGDKNYHFLLEELLQADSRKVEVLNFSVGAYDLPEEVELFERFGPRYGPDVVLHGIFIGNDFWGNPREEPAAWRGIDMEYTKGPAGWLPHHFLLRQWLANTAVALRDARQRTAQQSSEVPAGTFAHSEFLRIERRRLTICQANISPEDPVWTNASSLLDRLAEKARRIGARYIIVIHPDQFQVEPALLQELARAYQLNLRAYDLEQPQQFLLSYAAARQIPIIDLLPAFHQAGSGGGLYLTDDTHYSERGNQLAAEAISRFLTQHVIRY
ncbi:MAG: SGNH/GDSL hydrolase family protein [Acidobacteriota bacterium]